MEYPTSKKIEIHRSSAFSVKTSESDSYLLDETVMMIGSYINRETKRVGTGLTDFEIDTLMPNVIGLDNNDRKFKEKVEQYFHELRYEIPSTQYSKGKIVGGGLTLEVGLKVNNEKSIVYTSGKETVLNYPINILDYIKYKHAMSHPDVQMNRQLSSVPTCKFFIYDSKLEAMSLMNTMDIKDNALKLYTKTCGDEDLVRAVCEVISKIGHDLEGMDATDLKITYRKLAENKPLLFMETVKDSYIYTKYLIRRALTYGILEDYSGRIIEAGDGIRLGDSLKDAVHFLEDKKNASIKLRIESALKQVTSK